MCWCPSFDWYNDQEYLASIVYKNGKVEYLTNGKSDMLSMPLNGVINPSVKDVWDVLKSRCPDRHNENIDNILKSLDIPIYNVIDIIKKTQGRLYGDDIHIEFKEDSYGDIIRELGG